MQFFCKQDVIFVKHFKWQVFRLVFFTVFHLEFFRVPVLFRQFYQMLQYAVQLRYGYHTNSGQVIFIQVTYFIECFYYVLIHFIFLFFVFMSNFIR